MVEGSIASVPTRRAPDVSGAAHGEQPRDAEGLGQRELLTAGFGRIELVVGIWTLFVYVCAIFVVRYYYAGHLPHYDSIGSYGRLFELHNQVQRDGFAMALRQATVNSVTWLQPAFVLLLSWAPIRAPEWLVGLNFVLLAFAQWSILAYGRTFGFSPARQLVVAVLPVLPGGLYAWDGGLQDLRRDPQMTLLLLACFFLALAYSVSPTLLRGAALGLLFALAQWSRDNAAVMMLIVAAPAAVVIARRHLGSRQWRRLPRVVTVPLITFVMLAGPYYWMTVEATLQRYLTNIWGVGEDRLESLAAFWHLPFGLLIGNDLRLGVEPAVGTVTAVLLACLALAVCILALRGKLRLLPSRLRDPGTALALVSGGWVIVAVILYNTLVLGYGARWYPIPFQPVAVGLVAVLLGLTGLVQRGPALSPRSAMLIVAVACAAVAVSVPARMHLSARPPVPGDLVAATQAASVQIADLAQGRPVAFLWSQDFGRHHVRYYVAQAGRPPVAEFEWIAHAHQDPIDLDQPMRRGDRQNVLRDRLDRTVRRYADFVLVCTETGFYQDRSAVLWPYQVGRSVVNGFLADPGFAPVASFTLAGKPFVLLENRTH